MFDNVGFNKVENVVFRQLVKARLTYPASKAAIVEYLKNHFDKDVSLSKIYRYLDKLSDSQHEVVQNISVLHHTKRVLDDHIDVLFYDVTTLYCKSDHEDELRKTGFSKEGRHKNPQIILGPLVSIGGYPLAYCIHEGNKYEGHTMLPVVTKFVSKYNLKDFIVVADSGLMNGDMNFTRRRIGAHVCICLVALKVYKELERLLKLSTINMSVDKVLELAQTIATIQMALPQNKQTISRTMLMKQHQRIAPLFSDEFWVTR